MNDKHQNSNRFPKIKHLAKNTFLLTVSSFLVLHAGCTSDKEAKQWKKNNFLSTTATKTAVTTIKEFEKGLFKVTNKVVVREEKDARIIVQYIDGKVDTLTIAEAELVSENDTTKSSNNRRSRSRFRVQEEDASSSDTHARPADGQDGFGKKSRRSNFSG